MTRRAACSVIVLASLIGGIRLAALDVPLTDEQMMRALTLARWPTSDADRARFHARYVVPVNGPAVQYYSVKTVDVMTEFRRLELIAEDHARVNDMFGRSGPQEVEAAIRPWRDRVVIVVRLQFAPNGFIAGIPAVNIRLDGPDMLAPIDDVRATAVYGQNSMLVGATVEAVFDARQIGQRTRAVVVRAKSPDAPLAHVPIDFKTLD